MAGNVNTAPRLFARTATKFSRLLVKLRTTNADTADYGNYAGSPMAVIQLPPGQTANALEVQDYQGNVLFSVDETGVVSSAGGVTNPSANSLAISTLARGTDGQILVGQTGAATAYKTASGDVTVAASGAIAIAAKKVTAAKTNLFYAGAQTGNGAGQAIAHGLGADPAVVLVIPTDGGTVTYTHDATNVTVTCTNAKKYDVLAIA